MDEESLIQFIGLLITLALSACFSAAEALLNRLNKDEIVETVTEGGTGADVIMSLLQEPRKYFATVIVAKSCLTVAVVLLIYSLVSSFQLEPLLLIVPVFSITLIVVFTEIVPKNYIKDKNRNSLVYATRFLQISYIILYLIIKPLTTLGYLWVRIFGGKVSKEDESLASLEDIETLISVGDSEELLEEDERDMLLSIFELPDTVAREIMVPRTDMVCLDVSADMSEILKVAVETRHSRIPVYEETIDNIIGMLYVKDMLTYWQRGDPINIRELIENRPPFIMPESKKVKDLLQELRRVKQRMAIIVDEYGGTAGLVTTEDIIEEIVGEIQDEDETDEEWFVQYIVDAKETVKKVNERLEISLPSENDENIGKLVADLQGNKFTVGESFVYENVQLSILEADETDILGVGIVKKGMKDESIVDGDWAKIQYLVNARMGLEEFNELLATKLTSESVDSIGGFVVDLLGEVPLQGKTFDHQGLQFSILEADERRILRIGVMKKSDANGLKSNGIMGASDVKSNSI